MADEQNDTMLIPARKFVENGFGRNRNQSNEYCLS